LKLGIFAIKFDPELFLEIEIESLVFPFDTSKDILKNAEKNFEVSLEFKPFENGIVENVFEKRTNLKALGCPSEEKLRSENLSKLEDVEYEVYWILLDFHLQLTVISSIHAFARTVMIKLRNLDTV